MTVQANVQENLPLTEVTLFIMLSLAPEPRHGYAIMKDVQALSEGRVVLSTGTLYGALKRLLAQGWIERVGEAEQGSARLNDTGRPRKAYTLTHLGKRVLDAEVARIQTLAAVARLRTARGQA
ncbi:MAG: helix-turn-helix transcriptional regulator [Chloroflexota bacterium]|nr:helix-turn-helix transcriptional regulator [Chloroflexota bacterium]